VAIKEMPIDGCEDLRTEFELLQGLQHENIVRLISFEIGRRHARLYLEWAAGGSLADSIRRYPVTDEALLRRYMTWVLSGLRYLHDRGIIHRDVKPKNILIDHKGVLKLTDFGLSRHLESMREKTRTAGTPVYMAPECTQGRFGPGSDIWAVGATMSELITRQLPWSHIDPHILSSPLSLLYYIGSLQGQPGHHPCIPPGISEEAQEFMKKCFAQNPAERGTCAELLEHPWIRRAAEDDSGPTGTSVSGSEISQSPPDSRPVSLTVMTSATREPK
jgi:serine/threonine protein kinase